MFLRATKRKKDGKVHLYWSVVENVVLADVYFSGERCILAN